MNRGTEPRAGADDRRTSEPGPLSTARSRFTGFLRRRTRAAPGVLVAAQAAHVVGDAGVAVGLAATLFFDVPVDEARVDVGLYLLFAFAPYALLAPIVAPVVARRARAHGGVLVAADAGRALLAVLLVSEHNGAWLYPLGFALLVLSRAHAVSRASLVPALVHEDRLLDANAAVSFASGIAGAVGGLLALPLGMVGGPAAPLLLAATVYSSGTLVGLWLRPPAEAGVGVEDKGWLTGTDSLRITAAVGATRICVGFTAMLVAFTFHGGDDRSALVLSGAALAVGTWLASVLTPQLQDSAPQVHLAVGALSVLAIIAAATALLGGLVLAVALAGAVGLSSGVCRLAFDAHAQDRWPPRARGPGYARYETLLQVGWVVGAATGSLIDVSLPMGAGVVAVIATVGAGLSLWLPRAARGLPT